MIDPIGIRENESATTSASFNGVRLNTRVIPALGAANGGDWCEAFVVSEDVIALSIGDVCGHGAGKTAVMAGVRQAIRDATCLALDPAQTLAEANRFLHTHEPHEYATAIFALFDSRCGSLAFANAGHPAPLMASPAGSIGFAARDRSRIVAPTVVNVPATTLLVFYTDGVSELDRKPLQGAAQLRSAVVCAFQISALFAANFIEKNLSLIGTNRDDAAIITAWTPSARSPGARGWTGTPRTGRRDQAAGLRV